MPAINITKLFIAIAIIVVISGLIYDYIDTKQALTAKRLETLQLNENLKAQNEAVERLQLKVKTYKDSRKTFEDKIKTKYSTPASDNEQCEAKLEHLQKQLRVWYRVETTPRDRNDS